MLLDAERRATESLLRFMEKAQQSRLLFRRAGMALPAPLARLFSATANPPLLTGIGEQEGIMTSHDHVPTEDRHEETETPRTPESHEPHETPQDEHGDRGHEEEQDHGHEHHDG